VSASFFVHFGSKQDLQLATVEKAAEIFKEWVMRPALARPPGMPRLCELLERWLSHVEDKVFAGGCFFTAASFEFDSRPGPVRNAIVEAMRQWLSTLTRAIEQAQKARYLNPNLDPAHSQDFVRLAPVSLSVVCFQYRTADAAVHPNQSYLDDLNHRLLDALEKDGRVFLSGTKIQGKRVLRACSVNHRLRQEDVEFLLEVVREVARPQAN
jgi:AcrR family transcriptional regulator